MNELNKTVNFTSLKRKPIRKTIGEGEGQIIIYNPSPENRAKIEKVIQDSISKNKGKGINEIEITAKQFLLDILPLTTNIFLELDRESKEDMEIADSIIADPDPLFEDVMFEVQDLMKEIGVRYINTLKSIASLPKEELAKMFPQKEAVIVETDEEKELKELEEKTKALKDKINNKDTE